MRSLRSGTLLLSLAALAACSDEASTPTAAGVRRSVLQPDGRYDVVDVRDFWRTGDTDWTRAIQVAVDSSHAVYFPAAGGPYIVSTNADTARVGCRRSDPSICGVLTAAIKLPSGTRVYGDGSGTNSIIRQTVAGAGVFMAGNTYGGSSSGITVENLRLENAVEADPKGVGSSARTFALWVRRGSNIAFRDNSVSNMGLFENDQYLEWEDSYLDVPDGGYTAGIEVSGNVGIGRSGGVGYSQSQGILIGYANGATITNNILSHYLHGVQWFGGNTDPYGAPSNPRKVSNITVRGNNVSWIEAGIWGGMGKDILVEYNTVTQCADVCLDSEGDNNALYQFNTASNAGAGVLSVFSHANNIVFYYNTVSQDDQPRLDQYGNPLPVDRRIVTSSSFYPNTTISVSNNTFTYTGATDIGLVTKSGSTAFAFNANVLNNVAIRMLENHNGAVQIRGNRMTFDRIGLENGTPRPAIYVGNHYGDGGAVIPINGQWSLDIDENYIHAAPGQTVGILSAEDNPYVGTRIDHRIANNLIRGFPTSIQLRFVQKTNSTYDYFFIDNNGTTGTIPSASSNVALRENYTLEPEPNRVAYSVRGPSYGDWQGERFNNETAGTVGQSRDLEAVRVRLLNSGAQVCYQVFVTGSGWTGASCDNAPAGPVGQGQTIQAVKIWLVGAAPGTSVCYAPHVGNVGWMGEVCDGLVAGGTTFPATHAVQALRVRVIG